MEFANVNYFLWGVLGLIFWTLDYFKVFRRPRIISGDSKNNKRNYLKYLLYLIGISSWVLIGYSLMRPRIPKGFDKTNIEVNDIFIVVDVSRSMYAEDFRPNRLEAAKQKIREFVSLRPTDRIGIIMFSEKVFTLLPLSTDLELVRRSIDDIKIGFLGMGTNIGDAIALAVARGIQSMAKNKIILLLTDGVSNVGSMPPIQAAEEAKKNNMKIYSIGIGQLKNSAILRNGMGRGAYQNIPGGSVDLETLEKISEITNGKSFYAKNAEALKVVLSEIQKLEKTKIEKTNKIIYKEHYLKYLIWGIVLLLMVEVSRKYVLREAL